MVKNFVDRQKEIYLFQKLINGQLNYDMLGILEDSQRGKSYLLWYFQQHCIEKHIPVALIDFDLNRSGISNYYQTAKSICDQLDETAFETVNAAYTKFFSEFSYVNVQTGEGDGIVEFSEGLSVENSSLSQISGRDQINIDLRGAKFVPDERMAFYKREKFQYELGRALSTDLSVFCAKKQYTVIILDTIESTPDETWTWINSWILNHIGSKYPDLKIVVAGKREAIKHLGLSSIWKDKMLLLNAFDAFSREDVREYFKLRNIPYTDTELEAYHKVVGKNPWLMSNIADILFDAEKT